MADAAAVVPKGYTENPDHMPLQKSQQKYGTWTWILMMFSMNTCIPMFFLGPIGKDLSFFQVMVGAVIGNLAAVVVMWLNGAVGVRHGITFPVQLRETFGFKGIHIPNIMRGISGLVWFGVEIWAGSLAIAMIVVSLTGAPADQVTAIAIKYILVAIVIYLVSFILVMRFSLDGIGAMANWAGPIMLIYFIWLVIYLATSPQFAPNVPKLWAPSNIGWFSLPFFGYLAVQTNWWATVALNISDISRGINPDKKGVLGWGLVIGIIGGQLLGTALGYAAAVLTGQVLPQSIIVQFSPGIVAAIIGLLFAFLAPWSTDMTANSIPLINILTGTFKMRWKPAVVVASIIAFFATPWWSVSNADTYLGYIQNWAGNYGILLGPIAGLMIGSYWVVHKQKLNMGDLYTKGSGAYWYQSGWSAAAYCALICTWVLCYVTAYIIGPSAIAYVPIGDSIKVPFPGGVIWYFSVVYAVVLQWFFATVVFKEKAAVKA
jgi:NCS1 family nucleobase:cation symporter-1